MHKAIVYTVKINNIDISHESMDVLSRVTDWQVCIHSSAQDELCGG